MLVQPVVANAVVKHFKTYQPRTIVSLPAVKSGGWQLKRYAVIASQRVFDPEVAASALEAVIKQLPPAGSLEDPNGNHGVGFQIVHFAEVGVVSPVFYWMHGSVLANTHQVRAPWDDSKNFNTGVKEVVGCVWEMQIVGYESQAWTDTMLGNPGASRKKLSDYLDCSLCASEIS